MFPAIFASDQGDFMTIMNNDLSKRKIIRLAVLQAFLSDHYFHPSLPCYTRNKSVSTYYRSLTSPTPRHCRTCTRAHSSNFDTY